MKRGAAVLLALPAVCGCQLAFGTIGSWTVEASPPAPINSRIVVSLADGRVAIFGGYTPNGQPSAQVLLYDPKTNLWSTGAPMPLPGYPDVVVRLHDGSVLVEGGHDPKTGVPAAATWLYDPGQNSWSRAGGVLEPRRGPSFAVLTDGRLLIAGGAVPLPQPVGQPNGAVSNYQYVASAEIFDPQTKTWSEAGRLPSARSGAALVALAGGKALAAGACGYYTNIFPPPGSTAADVFDPGTSTWSATAPLPAPVCGAEGFALPDGRALLVEAGGLIVSGGSAYVYDPKERAWAAAGSLAGGGANAVMLSDGRVLVPEVQQGVPKGRIFMEVVGGQIFDPATGQWSFVTTTSVAVSIAYLNGGTALAASLPDGSAVILLETATLAFHPRIAPPAAGVLDSTGLTITLAGVAALVAVLLLLAYVRAGRSELLKLA